MTEPEKGLYVELLEAAKSRVGARDQLRRRAALAEITVRRLEDYIRQEIASGIPWHEIPGADRWPAFNNSAERLWRHCIRLSDDAEGDDVRGLIAEARGLNAED